MNRQRATLLLIPSIVLLVLSVRVTLTKQVAMGRRSGLGDPMLISGNEARTLGLLGVCISILLLIICGLVLLRKSGNDGRERDDLW